MYYEETIINGVLHVRGTPDGEWRKLSAEAITLKYMEAKREAAQQNAHTDLAVCTCGSTTRHKLITACSECGLPISPIG